MGPFLTIRKRAEDSCRTEAAIPGHGARPDLHLVLSGSAKVCQHSLVSVTLCVVALIFTTPLLQHEKHELAGLEESVKQDNLKNTKLKRFNYISQSQSEAFPLCWRGTHVLRFLSFTQ